MTSFRSKRALAVLGLAAFVAACGAPAPPPPTVAEMTIRATADANPGPSGASPTVVHVYALKPGAPFAIGDYDALTGGQLGELAETMTRVARLVVTPGEEVKKTFDLPDGTAEVGVTAAYRQIDTASWRASKPVAPHAVTPVTATIGTNAVTLE
jgi:type VI secretion system protein VasD